MMGMPVRALGEGGELIHRLAALIVDQCEDSKDGQLDSPTK